MSDDLHFQSNGSGQDGENYEQRSLGQLPHQHSHQQPNLPPADREVPIPATPTVTPLNQWLDGETSSAAVLATPSGGEDVDLWNKINDEAEVLRSRTTPLYVHKRIMDALPADTYRKNQPWYRRSISITPVALAAAGAALLAIGAVIARLAAR